MGLLGYWQRCYNKLYEFSIYMVWAWSKWFFWWFYSSLSNSWLYSLFCYVYKWSKWYLLWFLIYLCWTTIYCCICISICLLRFWHIICTSYYTCKLLLSTWVLELSSTPWSSKFRMASSRHKSSSLPQYWFND